MKHALNGLLTLALVAAATAVSTISAVAEDQILVTSGENRGEVNLRIFDSEFKDGIDPENVNVIED